MHTAPPVARRAMSPNGVAHGKLVVVQPPEMMFPMSATPEEAQRLLDEVVATTRQTDRDLEQIEAEAARRRAEARRPRQVAVRAAMEAGIPRKQIAAAAGVGIARLYQIAEGVR